MKINDRTRRVLKARRESLRMKVAGYTKHETDWEIHRGAKQGQKILDAKVSSCGMYVWTKVGKPEPTTTP